MKHQCEIMHFENGRSFPQMLRRKHAFSKNLEHISSAKFRSETSMTLILGYNVMQHSMVTEWKNDLSIEFNISELRGDLQLPTPHVRAALHVVHETHRRA